MSGVQSIERAFALLRALSIGPAGVTELAERSDLPKSTVARILGTLEAENMVEQEEAGGLYRLGPGLADLAGWAPSGRNLIATARPHLLELNERTNETAGISILDGETVRYVDHVESDEGVLARSWTGETLPLHVVPSGLVLLSAQGDDFVEDYLARPLAAVNEETSADPATIRERLRQIRDTGYLWVHTEYDTDMSSVAAPVADPDGHVVAAMHIHGPAFRFPEQGEEKAVGRLLADSADRLAAQLT